MLIRWLWFCASLVLLSSHLGERAEAAADSGTADIECLALTIYFEARGEPDIGKVAVAHVVLNRSHDARFPRRICDVAWQHGDKAQHTGCQFSWTCDGLSDRPKDLPAWQRSKEIARAVYYGRSRDPTSGATFYHNDSIDPAWSHELKPLVRIGHHLFYRDGVTQQPAAAVRIVRDYPRIGEPGPFSLGEPAARIGHIPAARSEPEPRSTASPDVDGMDEESQSARIDPKMDREGNWPGHGLSLVTTASSRVTIGHGTTECDIPVH